MCDRCDNWFHWKTSDCHCYLTHYYCSLAGDVLVTKSRRRARSRFAPTVAHLSLFVHNNYSPFISYVLINNHTCEPRKHDPACLNTSNSNTLNKTQHCPLGSACGKKVKR